MTKTHMDRLRPEIRPYLEIEGRQRLYDCWHRIFVHTPSSREAFRALEDCLNAGPSTKPRGLILVGDADTGKSRTMTAFRDAHPPHVNLESEYAEHPVIYLTAPDIPSRTAFLKKILATLGYPLLYNANEEDLRSHTIAMIRGCQVKTVMIDELHDLDRDAMRSKVLDFMRFLKSLINECGRPFVVGGTADVLEFVANDEQMVGRLKTVVELEPFTFADFCLVFAAFERVLPLREESGFRNDEDLANYAYDHTNGYIGRLSNLLYDACQLAIDSGDERITLRTLETVQGRTIKAFGSDRH